MSEWSYTDEELDRYFSDPKARQGAAAPGPDGLPPAGYERWGLFRFFQTRLGSRRKAQAALALTVLLGLMLSGVLAIGGYMLTLSDELPSLAQLENPELQLATIAYTADGEELVRYARENRSWVTVEEISPHVLNALIATEDHRFYEHWGMDMFRTFTSIVRTVFGDRQGGSTITQQLARNLYNEQIGRRVTVGRKLKEMVTAAQLERRYTKREIVQMYLNTVEYVYNAFGIEAAARTFFGTSVSELDELQSAMLIGMLQNPSLYNPIRFPERAQRRRNVVLSQMVKRDLISRAFYDAHKDEPVGAQLRSADITESFAPYFAEHVRGWMGDWAEANGYDLYADGLVVFTTLDAKLQTMAQASVEEQMVGLQAVVDYEWGKPNGNYRLGSSAEPYLARDDVDPFAFFWETRTDLVNSFIKETPRFRRLRQNKDLSVEQALAELRANTAFIDSLRATKTRLEAGLVSIDPRSGYVKAWVGGRNLADDWYDHVAKAKRQPGSTFKPFVYTAAIYNGWSPSFTLPDSSFRYTDAAGNVWSPSNEGGMTGQMMTLREGLAHSKNTITARLMLEMGAAQGPAQTAFFARRMGVKSELAEVPALALGVSDVTLLEMTSAYTTFANGGLYNEPVVVTRIEDRFGSVLYEDQPAPQEALSEEVAYTMVDMLRAVVDRGTAIRLRGQYGLQNYDLAGKTGTTQNSADGWFIMMHPDLVTGGWVGFNDRRVTFRTNWWGQGAHNAMFIVGDYFRRATRSDEVQISKTRFPDPEDFGLPSEEDEFPSLDRPRDRRDRNRVSW